ncbi:hypothetical protein ENHY17A_110233 [Moraxellaceae bacterium 17A]|nr:hypothetical protein ENHY17A_110233 [Moraxellaceae bacterium 17A]
MQIVKNVPFTNSYLIKKDEFDKLYRLYLELRELRRWLAYDEKINKTLEYLEKVYNGTDSNRPYKLRDALLKIDADNGIKTPFDGE